MTEVFFGGGFWLITQVALLILHYGNIVQGLPWWVIWFPSLLALGVIAIGLLIMAIVIIIGVFS
jgi:hypothetical protein